MKKKLLSVISIVALFFSMAPIVGKADVDDPTNADNPAQQQDKFIRDLMDGMTIEEKVGQLFIVHVYGKTAEDATYEQTNLKNNRGGKNFKEVIEKYNIGGVIYFNWTHNITDPIDPAQTNKLSNDIQKIAMDHNGIPLFIATDQEGGLVQRVRTPGTDLPGNMALGATGSEDLAFESAAVMGRELKALGINMNFAPTVDVNSNYENPVIGVRSFGEDANLVSRLGVAQVKGYQSVDVMATAKHFPGHGDTNVDSHYGLPQIDRSLEELYEIDLKPFKDAMDQGIDAIMTAHIVVPALDNSGLPATLSKPILTDLLRNEFGYEGLIVTDSLGMSGANVLKPEEVPVAAFLAGNDILLNPPNVELSYKAVLNAVNNGTISEERLDESVYRILKAKLGKDLFENPYAPAEGISELGKAENIAIATEISNKAVTLLENDNNVLPLQKDQKLYVTGWSKVDALKLLLTQKGFTLVDNADDADVIVATTYNAHSNATQKEGVLELQKTGKPVVVTALRNPYDLMVFPEVDGFLASYGNLDINLVGVANALAGEINPTGKLPVAIPGIYDIGHSLSYVDLAPLQNLIAEASAISNEDATYTDDSYQALQDAIAKAQEALETIQTEEELQKAIAELQAAIDGLLEVPKKVDTSA
ncbi:glycoside hydrolase family 3 protein, partial [Bacillus sp. DFI.2.34]|nr:glycoside hydrolase family 3 protein [Bacillus sp. DFI.2.34]